MPSRGKLVRVQGMGVKKKQANFIYRLHSKLPRRVSKANMDWIEGKDGTDTFPTLIIKLRQLELETKNSMTQQVFPKIPRILFQVSSVQSSEAAVVLQTRPIRVAF